MNRPLPARLCLSIRQAPSAVCPPSYCALPPFHHCSVALSSEPFAFSRKPRLHHRAAYSPLKSIPHSATQQDTSIMAPVALTPDQSGTSTPTSTSASALTQAGIKHALNGSAAANGSEQQQPLDTSPMTYTHTSTPRTVPEPDSAETKAQKTCTDHMVSARWTIEHGWDAPELKPYGPLAIMPSASVLHYATECFEGLKLYRGFDGRLRLFRVSRNCQRMLKSARRIALPDFDPKELEKMIIALCATDGDKWLPNERAGHFLYIRPTLIATDAALGVQRPREALLYVIIACFPDMSKSIPPALNGSANGTQAKPGLKLLASNEDTIRAWPGGVGYAKLKVKPVPAASTKSYGSLAKNATSPKPARQTSSSSGETANQENFNSSQHRSKNVSFSKVSLARLFSNSQNPASANQLAILKKSKLWSRDSQWMMSWKPRRKAD